MVCAFSGRKYPPFGAKHRLGAMQKAKDKRNLRCITMKTDVKTTCKYCEKPTIKTIPKRKKLKPDQKYYFTYYYKCTDYPKCRGIFHVKEAMVWVD